MSTRWIIASPVILVIFIALFRATFIYKPEAAPRACINSPNHERIKLDPNILARFKGALDIPTISYQSGVFEPDNLIKLAQHIEMSFPEIHKAVFIRKETISNYTLLYSIEGTNKNLKPYMLTSHLDVVPVVAEQWSSDPFDAVVKEDRNIYARGTIDAKHLLMSMLEAFEFMVRKGFQPRRSFYLVFGHDEEVGGDQGAIKVRDILRSRLEESGWNKLEYILDEGCIISKSKFPGLDADIGLIGVVEKGYLTVKVNVTGSVGHGSMPPALTAISKLSKALGKFHSHLLPSFMGQGIEREMIEIMARYSSWPYKLLYSNFWLFKPVFDYIFSSNPSLNSLIRTSTAVTLIQGGTKENVLPDSAVGYINHRLHPLHTIADIVEFDRGIINDPTISVEASGHRSEPTPIAPYCDDPVTCYGYQLIKQSLLQVYPGIVVTPCTFLAASDSRYYTSLTKSIYKFSPIAVHLDEMNRFHGHDERISLDNYENLINFYQHLIENSDVDRLDLNMNRLKDEL